MLLVFLSSHACLVLCSLQAVTTWPFMLFLFYHRTRSCFSLSLPYSAVDRIRRIYIGCWRSIITPKIMSSEPLVLCSACCSIMRCRSCDVAHCDNRMCCDGGLTELCEHRIAYIDYVNPVHIKLLLCLHAIHTNVSNRGEDYKWGKLTCIYKTVQLAPTTAVDNSVMSVGNMCVHTLHANTSSALQNFHGTLKRKRRNELMIILQKSIFVEVIRVVRHEVLH